MDPELKQCWTEVINQLKAIADQLQAIRSGQEAAHNSSEALRQQAETALAIHRQQTEAYLAHVEFDSPPDYYPFIDLPTGTEIRELPDGNRIFLLPDGMIIKTTEQKEFVVHADGNTKIVQPGPGAQVEVIPGRFFQLVPDWLELTMDAAGINGLPLDAVITQLTAQRVSVVIAALRLVKDDQQRTLTVINPSGSVILLGSSLIESIGEEVEVKSISTFSRSFLCLESGHAGLITEDGTVQLTLQDGIDLVITFPEENSEQPADQPESLCNQECAGQV